MKKRLSVFFSVFCVIALIAITMIPAFADVPANPEDNTLYPYRVELTGYITTNDGVRHVLRSLVVSSSKFGMGLRQSSYTSGQWCQTYDYDLTDGQTVYFLNYRDGVLHDDHTYTSDMSGAPSFAVSTTYLDPTTFQLKAVNSTFDVPVTLSAGNTSFFFEKQTLPKMFLQMKPAGILAEVVALLPTIVLFLVGFLAISKAWSFLSTILRTA